MSIKEDVKAGAGFTIVFVWIVGLMLLGSAMYYEVLPYFVARQRQVIVHSQQYITTQETALRTFKSDYDALEVKKTEVKGNQVALDAITSQQNGIVRQMKQIYDTIDHSLVSSDLREFLAGH